MQGETHFKYPFLRDFRHLSENHQKAESIDRNGMKYSHVPPLNLRVSLVNCIKFGTGPIHPVPTAPKKKGYLHNSKKMLSNVVLPGIEPGLARPQRDVLPLDHSTRCYWSVRWLCYPEKVALKVIFRLRI